MGTGRMGCERAQRENRNEATASSRTAFRRRLLFCLGRRPFGLSGAGEAEPDRSDGHAGATGDLLDRHSSSKVEQPDILSGDLGSSLPDIGPGPWLPGTRRSNA